MQHKAPPSGNGRRARNDPSHPADVGVEPIRAELEKILASKAFLRSERLSRFLRFTVEQVLQGQADSLKEYTLGVEVFDRRKAYDPRIDAVVRVEARRVRSKLKEYYQSEGRDDSVLIDLPKGSYVQVFKRRKLSRSRAARIRSWLQLPYRRKTIALAAVLLLVGMAIYWLAALRIGRYFRPILGKEAGVEETAVPSFRPVSSIVALPFADLSPQKDQEYFCEGMTDELINALTKVDGLRVLSQSSAFQFKGDIDDVRKIGQQLRVDTVLKGSVRKAASRLRITVHLINVADGYYLWSETYDREIKDLIAVQEEISRAIVNTLRIQLAGSQRRPLVKAYTGNLQAYDLYLKGRYHWNKRTAEGLRQAAAFFEQAVKEDANYALGYAALADSYALLSSYGVSPPREVMQKAKAAALKALEIDETLGEAHASLGFVRSFYDWEWSDAEREYRRALELNPGYATAHHWYSGCLRALGRFDEAAVEVRRAQELDPLSPAIGRDLGRIFSSRRQHEQAIDQYRKTLDLNPNFPSGYVHLGLAYEQLSRYDEAIAAFEKARAMPGGNPLIAAALGHCHALMGNRVKAGELLDELVEQSKQRYVPAVDIALIYIGLGEKDRAFEWLEKAYEDHDGWLAWLKVDPIFDSLRRDARFIRLLKKVGLQRP